MIFLYYFLLFILGLFVGSFLNLVSDRILTGEPILRGRSHCEHCKKFLSPFELVPVLSFIVQGGKCSCRAHKLSFYYPASELLTGVLFVLMGYFSNFLNSPDSIVSWIILTYLLFIACIYIIMILTDFKFRIIPDAVVFPGLLVSISFLLFSFIFTSAENYYALNSDAFGKYLIEAGFWELRVLAMGKALLTTIVSSILIGLFFFFLTLIKGGRAMGGGDLKLAILIGLFNGFPNNVLAIFLGFLLGSVFSLFLVATKVKSIKDTIPFGPFLIFGSLLAFFFGKEIINWYLYLFV